MIPLLRCVPDSPQILGYDILLDADCRPLLLEINHAPSLRIDEVVPLDALQPAAAATPRRPPGRSSPTHLRPHADRAPPSPTRPPDSAASPPPEAGTPPPAPAPAPAAHPRQHRGPRTSPAASRAANPYHKPRQHPSPYRRSGKQPAGACATGIPSLARHAPPCKCPDVPVVHVHLRSPIDAGVKECVVGAGLRLLQREHRRDTPRTLPPLPTSPAGGRPESPPDLNEVTPWGRLRDVYAPVEMLRASHVLEPLTALNRRVWTAYAAYAAPRGRSLALSLPSVRRTLVRTATTPAFRSAEIDIVVNYLKRAQELDPEAVSLQQFCVLVVQLGLKRAGLRLGTQESRQEGACLGAVNELLWCMGHV